MIKSTERTHLPFALLASEQSVGWKNRAAGNALSSWSWISIAMPKLRFGLSHNLTANSVSSVIQPRKLRVMVMLLQMRFLRSVERLSTHTYKSDQLFWNWRHDRHSQLTLALLAPVNWNCNANHLLGGILAVIGVAAIPRIGCIVGTVHVQPESGRYNFHPSLSYILRRLTFRSWLTSTSPN